MRGEKTRTRWTLLALALVAPACTTNSDLGKLHFLGGSKSNFAALGALNNVSMGRYKSCFETSAGTYCIGTGIPTPRLAPPGGEMYPVVTQPYRLNPDGYVIQKTFLYDYLSCAIAHPDDTAICFGPVNQQLRGYRGPNLGPFTTVSTQTGPLMGVEDIAVGAGHACALTITKDIFCWGTSAGGKLGFDPTQATSPSPFCVQSLGVWECVGAIQLVGNFSDVIDLEAGNYHTCALTSAGEVKCWGLNINGELGRLTGATYTPLPASLPASFAADNIATGFGHTCAKGRNASGASEIYCWGINNHAQVGVFNGQNCAGFPNSPGCPVPIRVPGSTAWDEVYAGGFTTCGRTGTDVYCWGSNMYGRIAAPALISNTPCSQQATFPPGTCTQTQTLIATNVKKFFLGDSHLCAIQGTPSKLSCKGDNSAALLGGGETLEQNYMASTNRTYNQIVKGAQSIYAVDSTGLLWAWGADWMGSLGNNGKRPNPGGPNPIGIHRETATGSTQISNVVQVAVSATHGCAAAGNNVYCWGNNVSGQLGQPPSPILSQAVAKPPVVDLTPLGTGTTLVTVRGVAVGAAHACALIDVNIPGSGIDDAVTCWGDNSLGQLGDGSVISRYIAGRPVLRRQGSGLGRLGQNEIISEITAGNAHTCARTASGAVYCWGLNADGQAGQYPVVATGGGGNPNVGATDCTYAPSYPALTQPRCQVAVLINGYPSTSPYLVAAQKVVAGPSSVCVIDATGVATTRAKCWGANNWGQLGSPAGPIPCVGRTANQPNCHQPQRVALMTQSLNVVDIGSGGSQVCVSGEDDTVQCWGLDDGRLGSGVGNIATRTPAYVVDQNGSPVHIPNVRAISANDGVYVLDRNGLLYSAGNDVRRTQGHAGSTPLYNPNFQEVLIGPFLIR